MVLSVCVCACVEMPLTNLGLFGAPFSTLNFIERYSDTLQVLCVNRTCEKSASYAKLCAVLSVQLARLRVLTRFTVNITKVNATVRRALHASGDGDGVKSDVVWSSRSITHLQLQCDESLRFPAVIMPALLSYGCTNVTVHTLLSVFTHSPFLHTLECAIPTAEMDMDVDVEDAQLTGHYEVMDVLLRTVISSGGGRRLRHFRLGVDVYDSGATTDMRVSGKTLAVMAEGCPYLETLRCAIFSVTENDVASFLRTTSTHLRTFRLDQDSFHPVTLDTVVDDVRPRTCLAVLQHISLCLPSDALIGVQELKNDSDISQTTADVKEIMWHVRPTYAGQHVGNASPDRKPPRHLRLLTTTRPATCFSPPLSSCCTGPLHPCSFTHAHTCQAPRLSCTSLRQCVCVCVCVCMFGKIRKNRAGAPRGMSLTLRTRELP
jgi:hypothetical protein